VLVQARAISRSATLPSGGNAGDVFILPGTGGANANAVALWDEMSGNPAWVFLPPQEGWQFWIADEARHVRFIAGKWVEVPRPGVVRIRTLKATSQTFEAVDLGSIIETTASSAVTVTIPAHAAVPFEFGTLVNISQVGAGVATISAASGVSLNGVTGGSVALDGQW